MRIDSFLVWFWSHFSIDFSILGFYESLEKEKKEKIINKRNYVAPIELHYLLYPFHAVTLCSVRYAVYFVKQQNQMRKKNELNLHLDFHKYNNYRMIRIICFYVIECVCAFWVLNVDHQTFIHPVLFSNFEFIDWGNEQRGVLALFIVLDFGVVLPYLKHFIELKLLSILIIYRINMCYYSFLLYFTVKCIKSNS